MNTPKDLKYTKDHEWARAGRRNGGRRHYGLRPGKTWGPSSSSNCPPPGKTFQKGQTVVTVDSVKAVAEVYAPLSAAKWKR